MPPESDDLTPRGPSITETTPTAALLAWFDRRRYWLWLALGLIYVIGFNGQWRAGPDSAIHVTTARSLAEGQGFSHPTGLEQAITPGLAYLTAATFQLFGVDRFLAINALMLLSAGAVLTLTYWVIRLRFDRPTAVLTVGLLAINETFYRYGYQVLTDMPFLLGLMVLLLAYELLHRRGSRPWVGIGLIVLSIGLMAVFRSVVVTVLVAGVLVAIYRATTDPGGKLYAVGAVLAAGVLLVLRWGLGGVGRDEDRVVEQITDTPIIDTLNRVLMDNGPALLTENLPEAVFAIDLGSVVSLPIGVGMVVIGLALFRVRPLWGLLVGAFIVQWLVFITAERYVLVLLPLLALAWWRVGLWAETKLKPGMTRYVLAALLALWFGPNLVRIGAFIVEQRSQPFLATYDDGRHAALQAVADELSQLAEPGDVIIADQNSVLTYYTRLPVFGPTTLPTFGSARQDTVKRMRNAERILMVSPIDDRLNERVNQLKLKQVQVLRIVPTPVYDRQQEYKIIQMRIRNIDWDKYRERRSRERNTDPSGADTSEEVIEPVAEPGTESVGDSGAGNTAGSGGGSAHQGDGQTDQQPGQTEQSHDQPR